MRTIPVRLNGFALVSMMIVVTASMVTNGLTQTERTVRITVPEGTVVPVKLDTTLSSARNQSGDQFTATVRSDRQGDAEFPIGTKIEGVVVDVQQSRNREPGMLDLEFREVQLPDGQKFRASGSLISLDSKSVSQTSNGRLVARNRNKKDRTKFIAIGAGAGLILGKLTKHTLEGTLLGAAAGYLYGDRAKARATDVTVREGTEFGVRLDRELVYNSPRAFAVARESYRYYPPDSTVSRSREGDDISVTLSGRMIDFTGDTRPFEHNGIVLVPLRPVMEAARVAYRYDDRRQTVRVDSNAGELVLRIGRPYALLEGERENLEAPAVVRSGEVFAPLRFLALATGMRVIWDAKTGTVVITSQN